MTEPTALEALQKRVADGIVWLDEHDPGSIFHLWFEAGLTPLSRMPAQDADRAEDYAVYYAARRIFERLSRELGRIDPTWAPSPAFVDGPQWHPAKEERRLNPAHAPREVSP